MGFRVKTDFRWPNGIIPYEFFEEKDQTKDDKATPVPANSGVREIVVSCMRLWEAYTNAAVKDKDPVAYIRFREREQDETPFLSIRGMADTTSGHVALSTWQKGGPNPRLIIGYSTFINAIPHELGHVLGLYHENERNLSNKSVLKYVDKAVPLLCPIKNSIAEYNAKTIGDQITAGNRIPVDLYDLCSIMHYPSMDKQWEFNCNAIQLAAYLKEHKMDRAFGDNDQGAAVMNYPTEDEVIGRRWAPSHGDIKTLRELYKPA